MSLDQPNGFVKHQTVTRDAFLGGRLTLSQPRNGFRAGLDSVLLGAAVHPEVKSLLDLGAGVGTAAFAAMAHNPQLQGTLVERDVAAADLATVNAEANGFGQRATVIVADVVGKAAARKQAGVAENGYDAVIANPPFFADGAGTLAADSGRAAARHMDAATLDLWVKTAAGAVKAGGLVTFVYPVESLAGLLTSFEQRFGDVTVLPLSPRPDRAVSRFLIRGVKGSRAPLTLLSSRALHDEEGSGFRPEFDAIFRGQARLDW